MANQPDKSSHPDAKDIYINQLIKDVKNLEQAFTILKQSYDGLKTLFDQDHIQYEKFVNIVNSFLELYELTEQFDSFCEDKGFADDAASYLTMLQFKNLLINKPKKDDDDKKG